MGLLDIFKKKELEPERVAEDSVGHDSPTLDPTTLKLGYTRDEAEQLAGLYLPAEDRTTHLYVLGSSGAGKSKGLANCLFTLIFTLGGN